MQSKIYFQIPRLKNVFNPLNLDSKHFCPLVEGWVLIGWSKRPYWRFIWRDPNGLTQYQSFYKPSKTLEWQIRLIIRYYKFNASPMH